jgi:cbb3-type cytochrome oxidase maturation protein
VSVVFLLLPLAILMVAVFVWFFVWAARDGQFDDVTTPPLRILFDEDREKPGPSNAQERL